MGLRVETREIDGLSVTTVQLPAMRSFLLLKRLGAAIAPALAMLDGVNLASDVRALAPALGHVFAGLNSTEAESLVREIVASTTVIHDGRKLELTRVEAINTAFEGRLKTMLAVLAFALEVNYGDFFAALASARADGTAVATPAPASP